VDPTTGVDVSSPLSITTRNAEWAGTGVAPRARDGARCGHSTGELHSEKIAGIDPESWPLVGLAIAISLLVASGVYWRRGRWFQAAIGFGILFAAADTRELIHQIQESRTAVATIAGILIGLLKGAISRVAGHAAAR
jgi:hypothetical protein